MGRKKLRIVLFNDFTQLLEHFGDVYQMKKKAKKVSEKLRDREGNICGILPSNDFTQLLEHLGT